MYEFLWNRLSSILTTRHDTQTDYFWTEHAYSHDALDLSCAHGVHRRFNNRWAQFENNRQLMRGQAQTVVNNIQAAHYDLAERCYNRLMCYARLLDYTASETRHVELAVVPYDWEPLLSNVCLEKELVAFLPESTFGAVIRLSESIERLWRDPDNLELYSDLCRFMKARKDIPPSVLFETLVVCVRDLTGPERSITMREILRHPNFPGVHTEESELFFIADRIGSETISLQLREHPTFNIFRAQLDGVRVVE